MFTLHRQLPTHCVASFFGCTALLRPFVAPMQKPPYSWLHEKKSQLDVEQEKSVFSSQKSRYLMFGETVI
jgi:hypothetical protein